MPDKLQSRKKNSRFFWWEKITITLNLLIDITELRFLSRFSFLLWHSKKTQCNANNRMINRINYLYSGNIIIIVINLLSIINFRSVSNAVYSPPSSSDILNFSIIATRQLCRLKPFRKPVWCLGKMFSKKRKFGHTWFFQRF